MESVSSKTSLRDNENIWRKWGILPRDTDGPWYIIYSFIIHAISWAFIACLLLCLTNANTIGDVIEVLVLSTTFILIYIKAICLRWNFHKVHDVFDLLYQLEADSINNETEQHFLRAALKRSRRLRYVLNFFCYFGITLFVFPPLIDGHKLLYPSVYPFDWTTSRTLYYSTFFFQTISNYFIVALMPSIDMYGPGMLSFLIAHLDILRHRLENLATSSPVPKIREYNLRKCVRYHDTCLKLSRMINEIFSIHLFLQISTSSLIVCSIAFRFSVINPIANPLDFVFLIEYMCGMVYQLFIPCYVSTQLTFCSAKLVTSMYFCEWTSESRRFKTTMMILVERAIQPIVLKAYKKLFYVTLEVFVSVMRFAYSMLTFIKSLQ